MKQLKLVIIEDDSIVRELIVEALNKPRFFGEGFNIHAEGYEKMPPLGKIKDAFLYILDKNIPFGKDGLKIAEELKDNGELGARIMMTGDSNPETRLEDQMQAINYNLINKWIEKPIVPSRLKKLFLELRKERKFIQKVNVGIIGLGRFGKGLLTKLKDLPEVKDVNIFSNFAKENYSGILTLVGVLNQEKIKPHTSLESLVSAKPDILFLTTGQHLRKYTTREVLFSGALEKTTPIFRILREMNYSGLVCNVVNPVGPILQAAEFYGFDPQRLTGFSPDTLRAKAEILKNIRKLSNKSFEDDIHLDVIGEHGKEIPLFGACLVNGKSLYKKYPYFRRLKRELIGSLRKAGLNTIKYAQEYGTDYEDAPNSLIDFVKDISHLQRNPSSCWYCYLENGVVGESKSAYLQWPVNVDYPDLRVYRNDRFELKNLRKTELQEISRQITHQNQIVGGLRHGK